MLTYGDGRDGPGYELLLHRLREGRIDRLAFAKPAGASRPLALNDLALLTAADIAHRGSRAELSLIPPEQEPLAIFGPAAGAAIRPLSDDGGVTLQTSSYGVPGRPGWLEILPEARRLAVDRVVTEPRVFGPRLQASLRTRRFIPTDDHGLDGMVATGDATASPVRHGAIAAQQAMPSPRRSRRAPLDRRLTTRSSSTRRCRPRWAAMPMASPATIAQADSMRPTRSSRPARHDSVVALNAPVRGAQTLLGAAEFAAYERELDRLRNLRDRELPERLRATRGFVAADAAEEIAHIREQQTVMDSRIARLEELLSTATVVADDRPSDVVAIGSTVEVEHGATGRRATYRLAGAVSGSGERAVSARSPVGRALLGRRVGDGVSAELPDGRVEQLFVVAVTAPLAEAS